MPTIGQFIKEKRETAGLSQKKLGQACGVSDSEIMKIESGQRKKPHWITLCKIAHALDFHPFQILLTAGYITEKEIHPNSQIHGLENLNSNELVEVQLFIDFLITRRQNVDNVSKEDREQCLLD